jgi:uncharacterized protein YkwD
MTHAHSLAAGVLALGLALGAAGGLAAPAAASSSVSVTGARSVVVHLTNVQRALEGCAPLKVSKRLTKAAQGHAKEMSAKHYFSHSSANGTSWVKRIKKAGWKKPGGENLADGFTSAVAVVTGWMNSPEHKRNILDCSFTYIGVGFASSGNYWVQDFGH